MRRPRSDVHAVVATVLAVAGAFGSFAVLQSVAAVLESTPIGRLAPLDTLGRLWVFLVLVPALLALLGVGVPCLLRLAVACARGALPRADVLGLVAIAVGGLLVVVEASMQRSGAASLAAVCAICLWRLRTAASKLGDRVLAPLLTTTSAALLAFGIYQRQSLAGEAASVAVAPTLFLLAFYATVVGVATGVAAAGVGRNVGRASASAWLVTYAGWIAGAGAGGAASTFATGVLIGLLAAWVWISHSRRVDESRPFL